jgi:hypothetical protein
VDDTDKGGKNRVLVPLFHNRSHTDRHGLRRQCLTSNSYKTGRDSALPQFKILTLYKLLTRSIPTYVAPVWISICSFNYLRLQLIQSNYPPVIGNHPRCTLTSHLQNYLNIQPIPFPIHRLTDKFITHCPSHSKPLVQQIGNYTLADLTNLYRKYKQKRTKRIPL